MKHSSKPRNEKKKINHTSEDKLDETERNQDIPTTRYEIIPLRLIARFFEEWSDSFNMLRSRHECAAANFEILDKMAYEQAKQVQEMLSQNRTGFINRRVNYDCLPQNGNTFVGPINRGPLHPRFNRVNVEVILSFEFDFDVIILPEHYRELFLLFGRLLEYSGTDPEETTPFGRFMSGLEIYVSMLMIYSSYEPPSFDNEVWEERLLTEEELSNHLSEEQRDRYRGRKFWAVRKNSRRSRRSILQKEEIVFSKDQLLSEKRWSQFVVYLMSADLQADFAEESLPWSKDFARLYLEYRSNPPSNNLNEDCVNEMFDTFLYSKISRMRVWSDCINFNRSTEWCQAWRRIMNNTNADIGDTWKTKKSMQFHQDLNILVKWLAKKLLKSGQSAKKTNIRNFGYITIDSDLNNIKSPAAEKTSFINILNLFIGGSFLS